jgi:hypothetical protein
MKTATETTHEVKRTRINRLLPYVAVFQSDLHHTLHSWLYRVWVLLSLLVSAGYVLYRYGAYRDGNIVFSGAQMITDLMRWLVLGSVTLVIIQTAGCISSELGNLADSILSRGISRTQYFLGKWHSRLVCVLGTFLLLSLLLLGASYFLLPNEQLTLVGCLVAMLNVSALLIVVVTATVVVSAMAQSTLLGVAVVWTLLYGVGFGLSLLPASYPSPERALQALPNTLKGMYDLHSTYRLLGYAGLLSLGIAVIGLFYFSRRDI